MNEQRVPIVGFPPEQLAGWPGDLRPEAVDPGDAAPGEVVLVSAGAAALYQQAVAGRSAESRPYALLMLDDNPPPQDAWRVFAGAVRSGEWDTLRSALACPERIVLSPIAEEMDPGDLMGSIELLRAAPLSEGALDSLPLPSDVDPRLRSTLATSESCRQVFVSALAARQQWIGTALHPPMEYLAAYAFGEESEPWVARHASTCDQCAAEVEVLRRLDRDVTPAPTRPPGTLAESPGSYRAPGPQPEAAPRIEVTLSAVRDLLLEGAGAAGRPLELINAIIADFTAPGTGLQPLGTWTGYLGAEVDQAPAEALEPPGTLTLVGDDQELNLAWSPAGGSLTISDLRGGLRSPGADFEVQLRRDERLLWSASSRSGSLNISLTDLERSVAAGATTLLILSAPGEQ